MRTLQDTETFRDLLYAVVTGQRNNEDSRRKAIATQAGRRRAIERGEFVAHLPDGYRLHRELDGDGRVRKRLELDSEREALFHLLFRLALRGRSCGQIAKTLNDAGWLTKPVRRIDRARPFDVTKVYDLLQNPRYAALSTYRGEVLARGHWPAYISERQHERIKARLANPRAGYDNGPLEAYLLKGLARCGRCGARLRVHTRGERRDGTRSRAYVCASHRALRGRAQCDAPPFDAHAAEAMVIASLPVLLGGEEQLPQYLAAEPAKDAVSPPRAPTTEADAHAENSPYAALVAHTLGSQRRARELADVERLREWIELEAGGRSGATRAQTEQLARLLHGWFASVWIAAWPSSVEIQARRRHAEDPSVRTALSIDRASWSRLAPAGHRQFARRNAWDRAEMIGALQAWRDQHGRSPLEREWVLASSEHPCSLTVGRHFGEWNRALAAAGLERVPQRRPRSWTEAQIIAALREFARQNGRPPKSMEWAHCAGGRPCAATVRARFGHFADALHAAGLTLAPRRGYRLRYWRGEEILQSLRGWAAERGRAPAAFEWISADSGHPCASTVRNHFGTWAEALCAAGLGLQRRS